METGPHHVCVLEVVVWNVWGLRGGGWAWNTSLLNTSLIHRIPLRESLTPVQGLKANMLQRCVKKRHFHTSWYRFLTANSPKDSKDQALSSKDLPKCQECKCRMSIVSTLGWLNFPQGVSHSLQCVGSYMDCVNCCTGLSGSQTTCNSSEMPRYNKAQSSLHQE